MSGQVCIEKVFSKCSITGEHYEPGSYFEFDICVIKPEQSTAESALYVLLEFTPEKMTGVLKELMQEGLIPYGMILFVTPGVLPPSLPQGVRRSMRPEEFDQYGAEFSNFLAEELIPEACRIADETLSPLPDMHFICGASSGGLAAWNAVWFRNDYFRRAFLSSPTFSAMRGGEEAMVIARKAETRPIKLYITCGTEEPDYFFGSSLLAAQNAASALEFAGYDLRFEQFNGEEHGCRRYDETLWRRMMGFIWSNWQTVPVLPLFNQIRIRKLAADGSSWQVYEGKFPEKKPVISGEGIYTFSDREIFFEKEGRKMTAAAGFGKITALALSTDKWRLYISDASRRFIFAMSVMPDGSLTQLYKLAPLHLRHDFDMPGAADMALLEDDHLLAATELGVQGVSSFGLADLILPLPGDIPAERIALQGNMLYVSSGDQIFVRELKVSAAENDDPVPPSSCRYGDGFSYNRSHLFFS